MQINLNDFLEELVLTELEGTAFYDENEIYSSEPTRLNQLIYYINNSLTYLHTQLPLLYKQCLIQLYEPVTEYPLTDEYRVTNTSSTQPYKFILDSETNNFYPHIIQILNVITAAGIKLPINDYNQYESVFTLSYNTLQIPQFGLEKDSILAVIYKAAHVPLTTSDIGNQTIDIPYWLLEVLKLHIGAKVLMGRNGANIAEANAKYQMYLLKFKELRDSGVIPTEYQDTNLKIEMKGFI
jgi:hypothetical protein